MADTIRYDVTDHVATISLDRPAVHNAVDPATAAALEAAVVRAGEDPSVRVVVLKGEGPSFCAGVDLRSQGRRRVGESHFAHLARSRRLTAAIAGSAKPVIAGLHGHVLGKGLEIALAADIRVATRDARLGFPEVQLGLVTDNGGSWRATALAGPSRAKYLLMTAQPIGAETALSWGLLDEVVEADELADRIAALARAIAQRPPLAVSTAKVLVDQAAKLTCGVQADTETFAQIALLGTADYAEARTARAAGRAPEYVGA